MHVESIKSTQDVYRNSIVTTQYTTLIDEKTRKRTVEVTTHEIMLYDRKATATTHNMKHNIDIYA
jgi:hypothetical protein